MNLRDRIGRLRAALFQVGVAARRLQPPQRLQAFGASGEHISGILVINLDRQPTRWRRIQQELGRFRTADGASLVHLTARLPAVDARDGRETAPTADVDPIYHMRDQLFVQPDERLAASFGPDEPIRMTGQEIAVARSHVEAWKRVASGTAEAVLILEDDAYFVSGAARLIDRGWRAARRADGSGPQLLYISYLDAGGTAQWADVTPHTRRPVRGLWYMSGYVLSRSGAQHLLRSMPVVGPVDLWINQRFAELDVLALARSALMQRPDGGSDNAYSIMPYLARAGVVDAGPGPVRPPVTGGGVVFAWNAGETDAVGMALSMLGYRVCSGGRAQRSGGGAFDAYVDAPLGPGLSSLLGPEVRCVVMAGPGGQGRLPDPAAQTLPAERTLIWQPGETGLYRWEPLCQFLGLPVPNHDVPVGTNRAVGLFHCDAEAEPQGAAGHLPQDASSWILPGTRGQDHAGAAEPLAVFGVPTVHADLSAPSPALRTMTETFPGNLATFESAGVTFGPSGATLTLQASAGAGRPFQSGALASVDTFTYGRFEAELQAARGAGLVTGFFLHRESPRQEIDVELLGSDPTQMLVNVYFNPGDEGATIGYGYRGTPHLVNLGFDASEAVHTYAVEWTPTGITWRVDGQVVHTRPRWSPTPIPHLPMRLHANLWAPRSVELAGALAAGTLPVSSVFRRITASPLNPAELGMERHATDTQAPTAQASSSTEPRQETRPGHT